MYRYEPSHRRALASAPILFGKAEAQQANIQELLSDATAGNARVVCLCTGEPGICMVVHQKSSLFLRRNPNLKTMHAVGCVHHAFDAGSLGIMPGSIWYDSGSVVVNLDKLLRVDDVNSSGSGSGSSTRTRRSPPLRALLWFLLTRAGLNVDHPEHRSRSAWADLADSARNVMVTRPGGAKRETLFSSTLYPSLIDTGQAQQNAQILIKASQTTTPRKLLFIAPFTVNEITRPKGAETFLRVGTSLGVFMNIDNQVLQRARSDSKVAKMAGDTHVLALGTVESRPFISRTGEEVQCAWVTAATFLPVVAHRLTPLPDGQFGRYVKCMNSSALYVTEPADDPLMRRSVDA